MKCTFRLKI